MQEKSRFPFRLALFMMAYYITNSVYQNYLPIYYKNVLGFNSTQIGSILAAVAVLSVLTQPFWGARGDRVKSRNALIRLLCVCSIIAILLLLTIKSYIAVILLMSAFSGFYMSIQPMGDSIILESLRVSGKPFGPIRLVGCLSFAVASMLFGNVINHEGRETWSIFFIAGLLVMTFMATYALPKTAGQQSKDGKKLNMTAIFKMKDLMLLFAFMLPLQITMGFFYTFFSNHFVSLPSANSGLLGWGYFISACGEIPYLLTSDKLFKKFGAGKLMCVSALCMFLRWLIIASTSDYRLVMLSQLLHGGGFIVITVSLSKYISLAVLPELRATGQMMLAVVSFGISRIIGNFGGGLLADMIGIQPVFYICSAICLLSLVAFAPYYLCHKPLNAEV